MAVTVKSEHEIQLMREAGEILAKVHEELHAALKPGMTTLEIDRLCEKLIRGYDCIPSFLGYEGYPASVCVSVNDEIVHGIPSKKRVIREGDIVSLFETMCVRRLRKGDRDGRGRHIAVMMNIYNNFFHRHRQSLGCRLDNTDIRLMRDEIVELLPLHPCQIM